MKLNCINNLHKCHANCCKFLKFPFRILSDNQKHFYITHGCTVKRLKDRTWLVNVPMQCPELKDNKCSLHDSPKKPQICQDYGTQYKALEFPENCIY